MAFLDITGGHDIGCRELSVLSFELFLIAQEVTTLDVVSSRNEPWALLETDKRSRHLMS
jgi:hypothetical protein